ncbi:MAG: hypothetical protein J5653_04330 [Clostridiales bacterium]|nr:hypothetical protein [Clostridiales bacterium]
MKSMKIKMVLTALTATMALAGTGCTLKFDGDTKQIESILSSLAENVQVVPDETQENTNAQGEVMNATRDQQPSDAEGQQVIRPSDNAGAASDPSGFTPENDAGPKPAQSSEFAPENDAGPIPSQTKETPAQTPSAPKENTPALSEPKQEETPAEAPAVPAEENTETASYKDKVFYCYEQAYLKIVEDLDQTTADKVRYSIAYIGWDDTPELVVSRFWDDRPNDFDLTVYTFRDKHIQIVLDHVVADAGYDSFFCYEPYGYYIEHYQTQRYDDGSLYRFSVFQQSMDSMIYHQGGEYIACDSNTPRFVLMGQDDPATMKAYLQSGNLPQEALYLREPADGQIIATFRNDDNEGYSYERVKTQIDDYSVYNGVYSEYGSWSNMGLYAVRDGYIWVCFYRGDGVCMDWSEIRIDGDTAVFHTSYEHDADGNGVIDPGETFYKEGTLLLGEGFVRLILQDIDESVYNVNLNYGCYIINAHLLADGEGFGFLMDDRSDFAS